MKTMKEENFVNAIKQMTSKRVNDPLKILTVFLSLSFQIFASFAGRETFLQHKAAKYFSKRHLSKK